MKSVSACSRRARVFGARILTIVAAAGLVFSAPGLSLARHRWRSQAPRAAAPEEQATEQSAVAGSAKLTAPFISACVMEPTTGTIIFEKDMHKPWPTASVTKMMLMLIAAEKLHDGSLKLTDPITTSVKAAKMGGSQVYLREGETFPLDDMMKAIVVHSANDASVAVAEYIAGSTDAFVQMMNQRAKELGLNDTHYYFVHGLPPARGQQEDVSSAYDCARLAQQLVKYPDVLRWSGIDTAPFRNGTFVLRNTNHLVRTFRGCDGLKTGFYDRAGFNVVATARRGGLRLIAAVMGSPRKSQNFHEAEVMLSQGFLDYTMYPVAKKGNAVPQTVAVAEGGATSSLKPVWNQDLAVFVKHGQEKSTLKIAYDLPQTVRAPVKAGQHLGKGDVTLNGRVMGSAELVSPMDVPRASLLRRLFGKL